MDCLIGLTKEEKSEAINIFQSKTRIGILVSYLKLIHIFEEKNNLKKTEINDPVISNIISSGRHIHVVISKNLKDPDPKICDYCYSTGNFILNKKVPEIITFFPSVNDCISYSDVSARGSRLHSHMRAWIVCNKGLSV